MDRLPNYDDANLILRLYEMRREEKMRAARAWFVAKFGPTTMAEYQELCPMGSDNSAYARMVMTYWEMVASFVTQGVLNEELFFQSGQELLLTYARVRPFLAEYRQAMGNPKAMGNLENVGLRYAAYWEKENPGAFEAFSKRVAGMVAKAS